MQEAEKEGPSISIPSSRVDDFAEGVLPGVEARAFSEKGDDQGDGGADVDDAVVLGDAG